MDDPPSDTTTGTDAPEWAAPVVESSEEPIGDQVAQPSDGAIAPPAARGPHLPGRWPAFVFFLLGAVTAWVSYLEVSTTAWTPESVASFALSLLPPVCSVLLPGALLLRHPEAPRRARTLLFGTLLFAAVPFFNAIEGSLQDIFTQLTPPTDDLGFAPLALVYNGFQTLLVVFGVLYLALGLSRARRWAFSRSARVTGSILVLIGLGIVGGTIYRYSQIDLSGTVMTPALWFWIGSSLVLAILSVLSWTYLAVTTTRGAMSGEEPVAGWFAAALGSWLIIATFAIGAWNALVQSDNESLRTVVFWLSTGFYSLGYLALLGGFLLGLPSLEPPDVGDEEPDAEETDDVEDEDDEGDEGDEEDEEDEEPAA